jgi:hypothetical protein
MNRKDIQWKFVGSFENRTGTMDVTDPCYDKDVWCRSKFYCVPGIYNAYIDIRHCSGWGARVHSLRVVHEFYDNKGGRYSACIWKPRYFNAVIGVDSGLCGFFDNKPDYGKHSGKGGRPSGDPLNPHTWEDVCDLLYSGTESRDYAVLSYGAFSSSGVGDGRYPCYVWCGEKLDSTDVAAAELRFL